MVFYKQNVQVGKHRIKTLLNGRILFWVIECGPLITKKIFNKNCIKKSSSDLINLLSFTL